MTRITRRAFSTGVVAALAAATFGPALPHKARGQAGGATEHLVEISGFDFQPVSLRVNPGDTITWINRDIVPHTATAQDTSWDSGTIRTDETKSVLVTPDMVPAYYCRFHPMMTAQLEIAPNP